MKILFGVSSVWLGHIRRSSEVARILRRLGDYKIDWVTSEPAVSFLRSIGEEVLPISSQLRSMSQAMQSYVRDGRLDDISLVARYSNRLGRANYEILKPILGDYDSLIQDEFAETMFSFMWDKNQQLPSKRVVISDYLQFESSSLNPIRRIITWYANRLLMRAYRESELRILADYAGSIPKKVPTFEVVGPILPSISNETREDLRERLFHKQNATVIVVSIGGTSVGKYILDFVVSNWEEIRKSLGTTLFVSLLGARLGKNQFRNDSEDLIFVPFTPNALEYFRAADCVVAQSGGSTLNEVASVGTPCVTIPIKNHWEQEANARRFSENFGFQVIKNRELRVDSLVAAIKNAMKTKYDPMRSDGANRSATLISDYLSVKTN